MCNALFNLKYIYLCVFFLAFDKSKPVHGANNLHVLTPPLSGESINQLPRKNFLSCVLRIPKLTGRLKFVHYVLSRLINQPRASDLRTCVQRRVLCLTDFHSKYDISQLEVRVRVCVSLQQKFHAVVRRFHVRVVRCRSSCILGAIVHDQINPRPAGLCQRRPVRHVCGF